MAHYQYEGVHYELPDGLSNEEAIGKIKAHLGKADQPEKVSMSATENPLVGGLEAGASMVAGIPSQIAGGLAGLGDLMMGNGLDAAASKVEKVQRDNFGMGAYEPSTKTGKYYADKVAGAFALPGEKAGELGGMIGKQFGNEALGELSLKLPVDAAMNFIAPTGIAAGVMKGIRPKPLAKPLPNVEALRPEAPKPNVEPTQMDMFPDHEGPGQNLSPQQIADLQARQTGTPDMFGVQNIPAQDIGPAIAPQVALRKAMDAEAAGKQAEAAFWKERAMEMVRAERDKAQNPIYVDQRGNAGEGQFSPYEQPKPVPEPIDAMRQHELFDQPEQGRVANPYEAVTGDWRVDENGMPIKADLSMDAAQVGDPLQRNLWGDELPRKHEQEAIPLTEAIDSMDWAHKRGAINSELKGGLDASPALEAIKMELEGWRVPKGQRGAIGNLANNASGESMASLEAQGRLRQEASLDRARYVIKPNGEAVPLIGVDAVDYRPRAGETVVQSNIGKTPWSVLDSNGVKNPQAMLARAQSKLSVPRSQRGNAPIINDIAKKIIEKMGGQTDSGTLRNFGVTPREPITPAEWEVVAAKADIATKTNAVAALKRIAPEYSSVTTPAEAIYLSKDAKDIGYTPVVDNFRNATISGMNGMVFLKPGVPLFNFIRHAKTTWETAKTSFSKEFVTGKQGFAQLGSKLPKEDRVQAMQVLKQAADAQLEITAENIGKLGLKPAQEAFILSVRRAMDGMWDLAADSLQMTGRDAFQKRAGYLPALWDGAYRGVVHTAEGKTLAVPQSDTLWGYKKAVAAIMKDNPGAKVIDIPRKGLSTRQNGNNLFNGFNDILNVIAKNDPQFAKLQMSAQMKVNESAHNMFNFQVHELNKTGVKGSLGDQPHLSPERNANDLFKALINYTEQGAEYYSMQKGLNDIGEVMTSPELAHMPNAKAVAAQYIKHVTGTDLNPLGAALNWAVDALPKAFGVGSSVPLNLLRGLKTATGIHMMGLYNPTFTALQLTQILTGASPEFARVAQKLGVSGSPAKAVSYLSALRIADSVDHPVPDFVPDHMFYGYEYAKHAGIFDFSELENAQSASKNKAVVKATKIGALPISVGEAMTRPPVFMTFMDMFHNFGLPDHEAALAAHHATSLSMGDYAQAERPQIYSQLGVLGEFGGALTTYKHNFITNMYLKGRDSVVPDANGKRMWVAGAAALAAYTTFMGLTGMPGYDELDAVHHYATGMIGDREQSIRETALADVPEWGKSGLLSGTTGLDFQSRTAMSKFLPEAKWASLSPQLSVLSDFGVKAYQYGKYKDEQSKIDFYKSIAPSGLKGAVEQGMQTTPEGFVTNSAGERTASQPRTETEQAWRAIAGIRPLRESIESKDVFQDAQSEKKRTDAQKDIARRMVQAFGQGDAEGMKSLAQAYEKAGGNIEELYRDQAFSDQKFKMNQSARDRIAGIPGNNRRSIQRYNNMNDGQ